MVRAHQRKWNVLADKSIEDIRPDHAAAIANGNRDELVAAKVALVEATAGRKLTADETAHI